MGSGDKEEDGARPGWAAGVRGNPGSRIGSTPDEARAKELVTSTVEPTMVMTPAK